MRIPKTILENLRFLSVEVESQISHLRKYFRTGSVTVAKRILDRSGYTQNLKVSIHRSCHGRMIERGDPRRAAGVLHSIEAIASDLDRIAELCRECIQQAGYVSDFDRLPSAHYRSQLKRLGKAVGKIERAIAGNDTRLAVRISRLEVELDREFEKMLKRTLRQLKRRRKGIADRVRALFVAQSIERMGDCLRNIGEAIISANLGQPFSTDRYRSLQASVDGLEAVADPTKLILEPIAQTRSGGAIAGLSKERGAGEGYLAIFKDGKKRKLKEEREGVETWHEIYPGLAPRILSYQREGQSASLLIEHLAGLTFEQIVLNEPGSVLTAARRRLQKTLRAVWKETHTDKSVAARFMKQLQSRLAAIYAHHPEFRQSDGAIGNLELRSFESLIASASELEKKLPAPFAVYIHGDFNIDNIIYDPMEDRINFIDLHRSSYMDYVQDVSVFMVSNYRLQVVDPGLRSRVLALARDFYEFAAKYARKSRDETFELRLALGLARSFATSTRFVLDEALARAMFLRAKLLLEMVLSADQGKRSKFRIPIEEVFLA